MQITAILATKIAPGRIETYWIIIWPNEEYVWTDKESLCFIRIGIQKKRLKEYWLFIAYHQGINYHFQNR